MTPSHFSLPALSVGSWGTQQSALQDVIPSRPYPLLVKHVDFQFRGGAVADYFTLDVYPVPTTWPQYMSEILGFYSPAAGTAVSQSVDCDLLLPPGGGLSMNCLLTGVATCRGHVWYRWLVLPDESPVDIRAPFPAAEQRAGRVSRPMGCLIPWQ